MWDRHREQPSQRRRAVTLIELLVVLAVVAGLLGLLLPAIQRAREAASRVSCGNNLKQLGLALANYNSRQGVFPPGYRCQPQADPNLTAPGWGWAACLLPDLEEQIVAEQFHFQLPVEDPVNQAARTTVLRILVCPSDRASGLFTILSQDGTPLAEAATNSYAACFGAGPNINGELDDATGVFFRNSRVSLNDISNGSSNTIALGERSAQHAQTPWAGAVSNGTTRITPGAATANANVDTEAASQVLAQVSAINSTTPIRGQTTSTPPTATWSFSSWSMALFGRSPPAPASRSCAHGHAGGANGPRSLKDVFGCARRPALRRAGLRVSLLLPLA